MKRVVVLSCLAVYWCLAPPVLAQHASEERETGQAPTHEAGSQAQGQDWTFWKLVNFAILAGALGYGISKKAAEFFGSRTRAIQEGIAEAARFRGEAEARAAEVDRRLSKLASDIEELRRSAREEMAAEGERIRLETEQGLRKIQAQAEQEIISAGKAARQELKAYAAQLALGAARQKIRSRLTPTIEDSLVRSFVEDLEHRSGQRSGRGQG